MNYIDVAHELTKQIPESRWTSCGELADAVFAITGDRRTGYAIAIKLLQREHTPWHRLHDRHGVYNSPSSRLAAEREEWQNEIDAAGDRAAVRRHRARHDAARAQRLPGVRRARGPATGPRS